MASLPKEELGYLHFLAIKETIFGQNPEVREVRMGFSLRVSHFRAGDSHQRSCRIVLNTNYVKKANWLTSVALVSVRTLRDVNIEIGLFPCSRL